MGGMKMAKGRGMLSWVSGVDDECCRQYWESVEVLRYTL